MTGCRIASVGRKPWWVWLGATMPACAGGADVAGPRQETASIEVVAVTSGPDPDGDGYTVSLNGSGTQPLGVMDTLVLTPVPPGTHTLTLGGVAEHCAVQGGKERTVEVEAGPSQRVSFEVACQLPATAIRVLIATTGLGPDLDGYLLRFDEEASGPVSATDTVLFEDVSPGDHSIFLDGLADNCVEPSGNPHIILASPGVTTSATLTVECSVPGTIVFDGHTDDDTREIFAVESDGSNLRRLTSDVNLDFDPVWSPDGARIAFWKAAHTGLGRPAPGGGLYVMSRDGSGATRLFEHEEDFESAPVWSPDGSRIAFSLIEVLSQDPFAFEVHLHVVNADGSNARRLTRMGALGRPSWSPDGRRLAFTRTVEDSDEVVEICIINGDGTGLSELIRLPRIPGEPLGIEPLWAPTGEAIAFRDERGDGGLYLIAPDGTGLRKLTTGDPAAWSPQGDKLLFVRPPQMLVIDTDGTNETVVADTYRAEGSWSNNGRAIAYGGQVASAVGAPLAVLAMNADGSGRHVITGPIQGPSISRVSWRP